MIKRKTASSVLAALLLAAPVAFTASAADAFDGPGTFVPTARDGGGGGQGDPAAEEEPMLCPEEFWTVPLQVEGLACVLLLPKDDAGGEDEKK